MLNLVIDIGNTTTKLAIFNNRENIKFKQAASVGVDELKEFVTGLKPANAVISSVGKEAGDLEAYLNSVSNLIRFSSNSRSSIKNHYKTPQTLGQDRYAAVIGAKVLWPSDNCLVIDAGTCITYDLVDAGSNYFGGSISPGLLMRYKALNAFTERLPLIEHDSAYPEIFGVDTRTSIVSGVFQGALNEISGFVESYQKRYKNLKVILCGGDVKFFDSELKSSIFAQALHTIPDLVLIGLNEVIHFNND